eukprot:553323_1
MFVLETGNPNPKCMQRWPAPSSLYVYIYVESLFFCTFAIVVHQFPCCHSSCCSYMDVFGVPRNSECLAVAAGYSSSVITFFKYRAAEDLVHLISQLRCSWSTLNI